MNWILDQIFGAKLREETNRYLDDLMHSPVRASRQYADRLLAQMREEPGPKVTLGQTPWGEPVAVPLKELIHACGSVGGAMGTGKSMLGSVILDPVIDLLPSPDFGFATVDPKYETHLRTLFRLNNRHAHLVKTDPQAAKDLRRDIVIIDFGSRNPVSSYNILVRWPNVDPDFFAASRAELLLDLFPSSDRLSLGGSALLQRSILMLSEFNLPITYLTMFLSDPVFRTRLLAKSKHQDVSGYFARRFEQVPAPTVAALIRRIDDLTVSESVRLALSGDSAPDFRRFQDEGKIVLINCFGQNISRSVRQLLQALVLSDIGRSVFSRREKSRDYLWVCDEAQNFFLTERLRDTMMELLTMSRSFGTYFMLLTQNISTAVQDARMLKLLQTILRWSFSMRSEPADCAFLKPALPVTGRRLRPHVNPFQAPDYYSVAEERSMALDDIAHLPDRTGYLWLRTRSSEAIKVITREINMPQGDDLERAVREISHDPTVGMRLSRKEYDRRIAERDREWLTHTPADSGDALEHEYRRRRKDAK